MPKLAHIPLCDIDPPPSPMRSAMDDEKLEELAASLKRDGQLQNVVLRSVDGRYQIIAGHRRYVAAGMAGLDGLNALVYSADEKVGAAEMFAENLHREDVNDADIAIWILERIEQDGWDEARLCSATGKKPDWIGDRYRLLRGDPAVFEALREGKIKFSVARAVNKEPSEKYRRFYLKQAIELQASQKQIDSWRANTPIEDDSQNGTIAATVVEGIAQAAATQGLPCVWCDSTEMQFNMGIVQIHHWCRQQMEQALKQAAVVA